MVQAMSALDDDATLTQLATAWVGAFLVSIVKQSKSCPTVFLGPTARQ